MLVEMKDIVKRYGNLLALDYFDLEAEKGEIYGLLGPNGSGKTTAINCMLSLIKFDNGTVNLFGEKMSPKRDDLKERIGLVMQDIGVYDELTVEENITYFCGLYISDRKKRKAYVEEAIDFVGMDSHRKFKPPRLSGGLKRRLNLACGIAHKPDLIILDEPTVAVDPQSRNHILENVRALAQEGKTIIYTTHYMEEVEAICDRLSIIDRGKVLVRGTTEEIKAMSSSGEIIHVKAFHLEDDLLDRIRDMKEVDAVNYEPAAGQLVVYFSKGESGLMSLLRLFEEKNTDFFDLHVKTPSLNDVFLEITGKELRDND
ncbi:MAG: ABC transporter ATP-binding protein [Bacillota bacterium]|nr:ABC transporter ATP-binding protein [Bacillota bacterium]